MASDGFAAVGRRRVGAAAFLTLDRLHLRGPDGRGVTRVVVRHPGAVALVPLLDDDVLLISQYRSALGRTLLELPAGKLDVAGEPPEETARRELQEEMGYDPRDLELLASIYTTPGFSDEHMLIYLATGLTEVPASPHGAEEEVAKRVRLPVSQIRPMLDSGGIEDAKTLIGLSLFLARS